MKNKTADEMFKELGYEDLSNIAKIPCIAIYYAKNDKRIAFYDDKTFDIYNYLDGDEYVTMQELKAINKKVEELKWNE